MEGVHKPIENTASYAMRDKVFSSVAGQKSGSGDIEFNLDPSLSGYFLAAAMGSTSSTVVSGSVKKHTHVVASANTPYSLSIYNDRVTDRQLFTGSTVDSLEVKVSDGLATAKATMQTLFPVTTASGTSSTASGTLFSWANYTYQSGSSFTNAGSAAATPLTDFDFTIKNNSQVIFESGQNSATRIGQKDFEVSGKMTLFFESTTDRDNYYSNPGTSKIITFLGVGSGTSQEKIAFNFYSTYYNSFSVNTGLDDFFVENLSFVGEYSKTDSKTMDIVQVNSNSNY